ncbi:hypothetical protein RhiirA5_419467 [Rhizophagus irregularis]|uniref:Uncharacterized protein n=3 Tax=Rhizophagus irregularis TaxID=588596 RepID=U9TJY4_RHIID|nr:hypothetical protein GLOIN_2v1883724 [Rhizophagus irregularis DAOM 181602=DAOM 197198]EXX66022.1 hypothetical protein RirG_127760 [Rhizophagus irregularis DAOM 197198w]PKC06522.1 hypothetical protein RhiirA5_419467 [Rhizophagus irregularis]PKY20496.1 hypothetical protein RhiirB3_433795 [Rhizophagus irregularis]POG61230.1 hypothetical protein GLOIN_2v1883724 [Rhizophagus irregularis DAOM 181602=DAOM 197198]UZO07808.1 hypothetical protein OCT59_028081 [Rhizophagus irregularis]|eukprot:XP_025168096.1 hypothetical protein GLOIN_2v1883724 [Rhizophagus irregularis DAOM 181602=DAOM 197198]
MLKITTVLQPDAESKRHFASDPVINQLINGATSDNINIKSIKKRKTDVFLNEVYKKSVSNKIKQKNKKKKLLHELVIQNSSSVMKDKKFQLYKVENIVQNVFNFTTTSTSKKNHITEIFITAYHKKSDTKIYCII